MTARGEPTYAGYSLLELARQAARGKLRNPETARFMLDPAPRLLRLRNELEDRSYQRAGKTTGGSLRSPNEREYR